MKIDDVTKEHDQNREGSDALRAKVRDRKLELEEEIFINQDSR